jgi:DNA-binding MarR family transcriptional regulator
MLDHLDAPSEMFLDPRLAGARVYASIVKELDAELKAAHGLPLSSFDVLVQLGLAPDGRMQMFELAEAVHISRSALTRQVDRLERQGLLERHRGEHDPRQVFACITEKGLERLAETAPTHLSGVRERFLERLSQTQIKKLADIWSELLEPEGRQSDASDGCNDT